MATAAVMPEQTEEPKQLSEAADAALVTLVQGCLKEEMTSRRAEVRKAWQQQNFKNGFQYLWWDNSSNTYMQPSASGQELPRYMDVYNIYTPHWRSFVSILSQNPPGINFVPDDLQRSLDVTAAGYAEKMRHRVDRLVHMKDRQAEVASIFCTDGRTVTWTRVEDGELVITTHGVLDTKAPLFAKDFKRWSYLFISEEIDIWQAKEDHSEFADDITSDGGANSETSYERYARLGILANRRGAADAETLKNLVTRHTGWIKPARYRKASKEVAAELKAAYPDGLRVTVISGKVVDKAPEQMKDAIRVEWPAPGKGSSRPSMLHDLVPIQEAFNDAMNTLREHFDFSIPATWVADGAVDSEALAEQVSAPGAIHTIVVPSGASISDLVMQEEVAQLPTELVNNIDRLLSLAQFVTGDLPSLSGEGDPHSETAQGQKMLSDQAKGQLSPAWGGVQWLFAGTYEIGVVLAAKLLGDRDSVAIQGAGGRQQFNPAAILDGVFGCYPNTDSSFPETMADQRASLSSVSADLAQAGPAGLAILMHPDNLKLRKQYSGLENLVIPGAEARDKQLREIEQLLREPPLPPDPATNPQAAQVYEQAMTQWQAVAAASLQAGKQPPPTPMVEGMQSSVPIGKYDYNQPELDKCIEWLSSTACFEEQQKGNNAGIMNVQLHADLHSDALAKAAAANAPQAVPMSISGAFKDLDPQTKIQVLQRDGYKPDPSAYEVTDALNQQEKAASTQEKAATAQHKSVLAAKEAVTPIKKDRPDTDGIKEI